jgi:hypothetical protein
MKGGADMPRKSERPFGYGGVSTKAREPALKGFDDSKDLQTVAPVSAAHPNFSYHGGPVISCSTVYTSFWGAWSDVTHQQRAARLNQFMQDFLASRYMNILSQYGAGNGAGAAGLFVRPMFVPGVASQLTETNIHTTIQSCINAGAIPEPTTPSHMAFMIFLSEGIAVNNPAIGVVMCEPTSDTAFGYHSFFTTTAGHKFYYSVIPALDNNCLHESCSSDFSCSLHLAQTQEQRQTQVASHEYSEMVTDPELNAWFDGSTGAENGDICNGESGTITVGANTWTVQRMYSKADDVASNGAVTCLVEAPNPIPKLSPGPPSGVSAEIQAHLMPAGGLSRLLPLPAVHVDLKKKKAATDPKEMRRYARSLFSPLEHGHLFPDLSAFLREAADAIQ